MGTVAREAGSLGLELSRIAAEIGGWGRTGLAASVIRQGIPLRAATSERERRECRHRPNSPASDPAPNEYSPYLPGFSKFPMS